MKRPWPTMEVIHAAVAVVVASRRTEAGVVHDQVRDLSSSL